METSMKTPPRPGRGATWLILSAAALLAGGLRPESASAQPTNASAPPGAAAGSNAAPAEASVDLAPSQLGSIKIDTVGTYLFPVDRPAMGNIDYDEDLSVQVFTPYQGKIIAAFANLGDDVKKGQPLYTIDSPDLIQAESTLIGSLAAYDLYDKEYARAKDLAQTNGIAQREFEQATSDFLTADGALKAARDAVRVFGKTEAEIDQIVASRKIDPSLVVPSPVSGRITSRVAQPGLLVQPGNPPAPYSVADLSTKWMVANVSESDSPLIHSGQPIKAKVMAFPDRVFEGKISALGTSLDPNTHRVLVRCDLPDPNDELRPGMIATFTIQVQPPAESVSIPINGVVRNSDGTFAAWVTVDKKKFVQRLVKIGPQRDGQYPVLEGLSKGELAVTDGSIFISNILYAPPSD
jgi:cobalt-zinc-cadmium efflux system membrane fusion protein